MMLMVSALSLFLVAAAFVDMVVGHAVSPEVRDAIMTAFVTGGAVTGGVLAVWAIHRKIGLGR